ncbi:MAG TPA: hypothetical protein VHY84_27270 [Bryobacteraceae bacterium]|jgi:hypothetical protein|nr:hypothetical protein [Bryobacteraceae bacterium]
MHIDMHSDVRHAARMSSPSPSLDTSNWPTLTEAAVVLGTNERTIRRWIEAKRLQAGTRPVVGRKPLTIIEPEGVERMRFERMPPVLLRDEGRAASNDAAHPDSMALAPHVPENAGHLQHFLAGVLQGYPVQRPKPWLNLDEAAEFSGLPRGWLLARARLGAQGAVIAINVGTEKQPRWRFNREALAK